MPPIHAGARAIFVLGTLAAIGCAPSAESAEENASAIFGGEPSTDADDAVAFLDVPLGRCTGVLVADRVVATAFHCVTATRVEPSGRCDGEPRELVDAAAPDRFRARFGSRIGATRSYAVEAIVVGPKRSFCNGDIAFLVLSRSVESVEPRRVRETRIAVGDELRAVGWGLTESGSYPNERRARGGVRVLATGGGVFLGPPRTRGLAPMTIFGTDEFVAGEAGCSGDSGGPIFDRDDRVAGIYSRFAGACRETINTYSEPSRHLPTLQDAIARAAR